MGETRKIIVSTIKTVDEFNSARVLIGCKPITYKATLNLSFRQISIRRRGIENIIAGAGSSGK